MVRNLSRFGFLLTASMLMVACMKTDPTSVRTFVREEIAKQFPKATIEDSVESEVAVRHQDGNLQLIDLQDIEESCKRVPRSCGGLVSRLIVTMQEGLDAQSAKISLEKVLPVIAPLDARAGLVKQNAPGDVSIQPIAEKLGVFYAVLFDQTLDMLDADRITKLGVSPEVLRREAFRNVEAGATVNVTPFPGEAGVFQIFGQMASSGILTKTHADKVKSQRKCKELAIAFPRRGMTLFACAEDVVSVARLREISARFLQPTTAVISPEVYLLTEGGLSVMKK